MTNKSSDGAFVSMCCKPNAIYPPESICYRNGTFTDENMIFPEIYDSNFSISAMRPSDFVRLYEFSCNGTTYDLEPYSPKNDLYHLMDIGWIYVNRSIVGGADYWLNPDDYCFTSRVIENETRTVLSVCRPLLNRYSRTGWRYVITPVGLSISLPFLAATFLIYTILPELRNLPGSIFRCFVAAFFALFAFYAINLADTRSVCINYFVVITHYSLVSTFFWMQVMCFDIWWTFRRFRSVQHIWTEDNRRKFIIYSIYAWGCSALIPGVGMIIDSFPILPKGIIRPGIGRDGHCGFTKTPRTAMAIYMYTPIAVTIISNVCFIVLTAIRIMRHEKDTTRHFGESDNKRHNDEKQSFHLYLKLFIIMGISWVIDFVTWLMDNNLPDYVMAILDLPNTLQGFFIFLIFVCKANVKRMVLKRLGWEAKSVHS